MCRLFGYFSQFAGRPAALSQRAQSFAQLSETHRDGWGLAYYEQSEDLPRVQLKRALLPAFQDPDFAALSESLQTRALIAHLRLATIGENSLNNNHPFSYQNWIFAHNGNIKHFDRYRALILSQIDPHFRAAIQGETDSELIFYYLLSELERWGLVSAQYPHSSRELGRSLKWALENLLALIGPFSKQTGPPSETYISFLLSNGKALWAHQGGQPLYYRLEPGAEGSPFEEILFCSEPVGEQENWLAMSTGDLMVVDQAIQLYPIRGY